MHNATSPTLRTSVPNNIAQHVALTQMLSKCLRFARSSINDDARFIFAPLSCTSKFWIENQRSAKAPTN